MKHPITKEEARDIVYYLHKSLDRINHDRAMDKRTKVILSDITLINIVDELAIVKRYFESEEK
jgi:hypothetical protein